MNLGDLRRRLAHLAGTVATEETRPPQIRLRLAGAVSGVHRCGPALITLVSAEERRPELEQRRVEWERLAGRPSPRDVERDLQSEMRVSGYLAADPATFARVGDRVLGMNSEERAAMLAELDDKLNSHKGAQ